MRRVFGIVAFLLLLPCVAFAQDRSSIEGFGGLSLNGFDTHSPSLGGTVTFTLVPSLQVVGEVGHLGNVLPSLSDAVFSLGGTGLNVSAFYGEGGVRLIAPTGAFAPYAEATAGFARLNINSDLFGPYGNAATDIALGLVGRSTPIASVGTGFLIRSGPVQFDAGYRYKKLFPNDVLQAALGFGQPLHASEVRAGIGVRF